MAKREIKFRGWDKEREKMTNAFIIKSDGSIRIWDGSGWGENQYTQNLGSRLMQFTGLKDKNGKEIYEGDIFEVTDGDGWVVGTHTAILDEETLSIDSRVIGKIVGNIYENPELVEEED